MPDARAITAFEDTIRGDLVRPSDPGFDEARTIYNAMFDRRPSLVAHCANVADVVRCHINQNVEPAT